MFQFIEDHMLWTTAIILLVCFTYALTHINDK